MNLAVSRRAQIGSKNVLVLYKPNDFYLILKFLCFGLTEKALFQDILGLLLVYAD